MEDHPTIVKVDSEKMRALEELARTNMDVSEGFNALQDLKGLETDYLVEREGKAAAAVDRVLAESEEVLTLASENNAAVVTIATATRLVVGRTLDLFNAVKSVMAEFDRKSAIWEKNVQDREDALAEEKNGMLLTAKMLEGERASLRDLASELNEQEARIDSKRQDVEKMITTKDF